MMFPASAVKSSDSAVVLSSVPAASTSSSCTPGVAVEPSSPPGIDTPGDVMFVPSLPSQPRARQLAGRRVKHANRPRRRAPSAAASDWMFDRSEFLRLSEQFGPFTLDACADDLGLNAQVKSFCSPSNSFMSAKVVGENVWLHPPYGSATSFLEYYMAGKASAPSTTRAMIVLPKWADAPWQHLVSHMTVVKEYPARTRLFTRPGPNVDSDREAVGPLPWPVVVYYDPPSSSSEFERSVSHASASSSGQLYSIGNLGYEPTTANDISVSNSRMETVYVTSLVTTTDNALITFPTEVNGVPLTVLVDCGASRDFIGSHVISKCSLPVESATRVRVRLANGTVSTTALQCPLQFSLQSYTTSRIFTVTELQGYDIILGKPWLTQENPGVNWKTHEIKIGDLLLQGLLVDRRPSLQVINSIDMTKTLRKKDTSAWIVNVKTVDDDYDATWAPDAAPSELPTTELPDPFTSKLHATLTEFEPILKPPVGMPPSRPGCDFRIELEPGSTVPPGRTSRMSPLELTELRKQLDEYLEKGWIQPSASPFGSAVLFARKADGSLRLCIDYRPLNKITKKDRYPLPRIDELIDQLYGATCFTSLDLCSGYHQVRMHPDDIEKTAFRTRYGSFEFKVLPFGLTNAPAGFMRIMNNALAPFLDKFVVCFLDDVLIYSKTPEEHLDHIRQVLAVFKREQLHVSMKKSRWGRTSVKFLGHCVSARDGATTLSIDASRVDAVKAWPQPRTLTEVRSFLGFTGFCRRFIKDYAKLAAPLTDLTKTSTPFPAVLPDSAVSAFETLKNAMVTAPVLAIPYTGSDATFTVYTDASGSAVAAVLLQQTASGLKPIAYESRKLKPEETRYPIHELELLAVVHGLAAYRCYLEGCKRVTLVTDHDSLRHFLTQKDLSGRQARWLDVISPYANHMDVVYKRGDLNRADALSRRPDLMNSLCAINMINATTLGLADELISEIKAAYASDPYYAASNPRRLSSISLHSDGFWYLRDRICIPNSPSIRTRLLEEFHDSHYAGHPGFTKTLASVSRLFWWPHLSRTVKAYVTSCSVCQRIKPSSQRSPGLLQPHAVPSRPWSHVSLDWITHLPLSRGYNAVLTVVDMFTKYAHFLPCTMNMTSEQLSALFYDQIVAVHGLPSVIVSDRDPRVTAEYFTTAMRRLGSHLNTSTAYHPETDGQTERVQRQLQALLRSFVHPLHDDWATFLTTAQFAYNSTPSSSTGVSPFAANHGFEPSTPVTAAFDRSTDSADYLDRLRDIHTLVRANLSYAKARQEHDANKRRRPLTFAVGDQVRLDTTHLNLKDQPCKKFRDRYVGPFRVAEVISPVVYRLTLPSSMARVHPVFHVSRLLPWHESADFPDRRSARAVAPAPVAADPPPPNTFEVSSVSGASIGKDDDGRVMIKFRVHWAPPYDTADFDSDEPYRLLKNNVFLQAFLQTPAWDTFRATPAYRQFLRARPRVLPKSPLFAPLVVLYVP